MPLATRNKNCCHCCSTNSTSIDVCRLYFTGSFRYMHSNYGGDLNDCKNLILLVPVLSWNLFALSDFSFAIILKQKEHSPLKHWNLFHLWVQNLKRMTTNVNVCSLSAFISALNVYCKGVLFLQDQWNNSNDNFQWGSTICVIL